MSRKRHKTAEALATMGEDGEYELVSKHAGQERKYRTVFGRQNNSTWFPDGPMTGPWDQYWNFVDQVAIETFNQVPQGTQNGQRIGNHISVDKVSFKIFFDIGVYLQSLPDTTYLARDFRDFHIRCVVLLDTHASLGTINPRYDPPYNELDILSMNTEACIQTYLRPSNSRFRVLYDETKTARARLETTSDPTMTLVSGTGSQTTAILTRCAWDDLQFECKHSFPNGLPMTFPPGGGFANDHRFYVLWTTNCLRADPNDRTMHTSTASRLYFRE